MELILSAILVGLLLSLVFIGPVFFLLIETSITKGWKSAVVLDSGVIFCDLLFIFLIYFSLQDIAVYIEKFPMLKSYMLRFGGLILIIYGLIMFFKKVNIKKLRKKNYTETNYFTTFSNGFLLNLLNVGVIFFWFGIVSSWTVQYPNATDFLLFITIAFGTFFALDLVKIILAQRLKKLMKPRRVIKLRKTMGIVLLCFGLLLIFKSYGVFHTLDEKMHNKLLESTE